MAGAGYKLFNTGDVLTAAQVNTYLQEQAVMRFANSTARTTALSGVLAEGMVSYLDDTNAVEVYNGSAWVGVSGAGDVTEVQAGTGISVASGTGPIPVVTNTMATTIDAKGDLIVGTGADTFARLAVGATNGHTLQVDSSTSTGLKWAAASGGASGLTFISRTTFSNVATVDIDPFNDTYETYLMIIENIHAATSTDDILIRGRYGTTVHTGNDYYSANAYISFNTTSWSWINSNGIGYFTVIPQTNSNYPAQAAIYFNNVGDASKYLGMYGQWNTRENMLAGQIAGEIFSQQTWGGIRLLSSSSNITGEVSFYGLAKA